MFLLPLKVFAQHHPYAKSASVSISAEEVVAGFRRYPIRPRAVDVLTPPGINAKRPRFENEACVKFQVEAGREQHLKGGAPRGRFPEGRPSSRFIRTGDGKR
jgi:hypothetical protein